MKKYSYILDIIKTLKEEPSRNAKIEILKDQANNKVLKYALYLAYNDYIQFYIRKIPEYIPNDTFQAVPLHKALKDIEKLLAGRLKTGNDAKLYLEFVLESVIREDAQIIEKVIARNFDCGVSISTINKVWPGLIPEFNVMLCSEFERERVEYPCLAQEKLDGCRALLFTEPNGKYSFRSRKGLVFEDLNIFKNEINKTFNSGWVIDGELLVLDGSGGYLPRKKGNGICNKAIKGTISEKEANNLVFVAWDAISLDTFKGEKESQGTLERFNNLKSVMGPNRNVDDPCKIKLVKTHILNNEKDILRLFTEFTDTGAEGIIVKNSNQIWEGKRSKGWMKMKIETEMELEIEEVIEGLGKHAGRLGTLKCKDASGSLRVGIGGGYSDDQREEFWVDRNNLKGKVITVRYNELISNDQGDISLFLPRFIEMRLDKNKADDVFNLIS